MEETWGREDISCAGKRGANGFRGGRLSWNHQNRGRRDDADAAMLPFDALLAVVAVGDEVQRIARKEDLKQRRSSRSISTILRQNLKGLAAKSVTAKSFLKKWAKVK